MVFVVDDALFDGRSRDVDLLALFRSAAQLRHTLLFASIPVSLAVSPRRDSPSFARWLAALPNRLQSEVKLLQERCARINAATIAVGNNWIIVSRDVCTVANACRLTLEQAVRAAAEPLHLMVENQINDAAFLRRVLPPAWRQRFEDWESAGQLRYQNGGGLPVMISLVQYFTDDANSRRSFGLPGAVWKLVHFLIYDHDGDEPDRPGDAAGNLQRCCRDLGMERRNHMLARRDQEHYLPPEALREIVAKRLHTRPQERDDLLQKIEQHCKDDNRHFAPLPKLGNEPFFKNEFSTGLPWSDRWFAGDGAWPEMTRLAERIAAAI